MFIPCDLMSRSTLFTARSGHKQSLSRFKDRIGFQMSRAEAAGSSSVYSECGAAILKPGDGSNAASDDTVMRLPGRADRHFWGTTPAMLGHLPCLESIASSPCLYLRSALLCDRHPLKCAKVLFLWRVRIYINQLVILNEKV